MVDREHFDEFLRDARRRSHGAERLTGTYLRIDRDAQGNPCRLARQGDRGDEARSPTRLVIGADGARSGVARAEVPGGDTHSLCHRLSRDHQGPWPANNADYDPEPLRRDL
jgi:geranylgeranyl reductase